MPTFKVEAQIYLTISSLLPLDGQELKFLQIHFMGDSESERDRRCGVVDSVHPNIVDDLQTMLHGCNPYIMSFKTGLDTGDVPNMRVKINAVRAPRGEHHRRFNAPTADEVAVLLSGETCENRDIGLRVRDALLRLIQETHHTVRTMHCSILCCFRAAWTGTIFRTGK